MGNLHILLFDYTSYLILSFLQNQKAQARMHLKSVPQKEYFFSYFGMLYFCAIRLNDFWFIALYSCALIIIFGNIHPFLRSRLHAALFAKQDVRRFRSCWCIPSAVWEVRQVFSFLWIVLVWVVCSGLLTVFCQSVPLRLHLYRIGSCSTVSYQASCDGS